MEQHRYFVSLFCVAFLTLVCAQASAEGPVEYYKAGDVGVFEVSVDLPDTLSADTVLTTEVSNEKLYLVYGASPYSLAERVTSAIRTGGHYPRGSTPEQQKQIDAIKRMIAELSERKAQLSQELQQVEEKIDRLKAQPQAPAGKEGQEEADAELRELVGEVGRLQLEIREVDQRLEATYALSWKLEKEATPPAPTPEQQPGLGSVNILGRFQGTGGAGLTVYARDADELLAKPQAVATVDLDLPPTDGGNPELLKKWATAQAKEYVVRVLDSPHTSYYQYCLLQSSVKYGLPKDLHADVLGGRSRSGPELYSMTTGALAIQETLQLDEMTGRISIPADRDVPIDSLQGPTIKSHPFEKMLEGRKPKTFPAASLVPFDNYYCHFTSISKEIAVSDLMKQWGANLLRSMTVTARDADLPSRYRDQLCLSITELTRLFGDLVIGEIVITGSDPFMKEGTDLAVIIEVKQPKLFDTATDAYTSQVLLANKDARVSENEYGGIQVQSIVTPDRRIASHSAYLGNYKAYSNSFDLLIRIIETRSRNVRSMADNLDFQYMRTIFPATAKTEDGFIYLSDAFIRKLLSARWKIEGQRRIICQNHLRMIANAATMHRMEMRKEASIETLIKYKYLDERAAQCPDGGEYSLDESGRAFCSVHNCLRYCTPIASVGVDRAARAEAEDYGEFVRRYDDYWSKYFDPIGIRLKLGDHIEVATCILPLIENSIYNQLREIVGGEPIHLSSQVFADRTVASIAGKLPVGTAAFTQIDQGLTEAFPTLPGVSEWIGSNLSLNFYDGDVLFTLSGTGMGMFGGMLDLEAQLIIGLIVSSLNLPVYTVVDLKDEDLARSFMRELLKIGRRRAVAEASGPFADSLFIDSYSAGQHKGHTINTVVFRFFMTKFRLHYAIASGNLFISTKRHVLEHALDSVKKMRDARAEGTVANVRFNIRPSAFNDLLPSVRMGWQERMREACLKNLEPVRALVECHGATEGTLEEISSQVQGVTLRCPSGGVYKYDGARNLVYCTAHGNRDHPRQPVEVADNEGLIGFLGRLNDLSVALRFTDEGIMTKVAFDLTPKKE